MFLLPAQNEVPIRGEKKTPLGMETIIMLAIGLLFGCTPMIRQGPPTLSGTFRGNAQDGSPVTITFEQEENTIAGRGRTGERVFSLSGLTSWHGPILLNYEDGNLKPAHVMLSPDGETVTLGGLGPPIALSHGGEPLRAATGPFAGHYSAQGPPPLWLNLAQGGNLLAGTGFVDGKPIAVVGKETTPNHASGTLLFSDESQQRVRVSLSGDGRTLTIEGLGGPIEMKRE